MSVAVYRAAGNERSGVLEMAGQTVAAYKAFREGTQNFPELHDSVMRLEEIISSRGPESSDAAEILGSFSPKIISELNEAAALCHRRLDSEFSQLVLQGESALLHHPRTEQAADLVKRELLLLNGSRPKRALVIGSGPFPITAIQLHTRTALLVDCIGMDAAAAAVANQLLERCGLGSRIRVASSQSPHRFSDYDLILVDVFVKEKKKVLNALRKRGRPGCQILCRTTFGLRRLLYEEMSERDLRGFYRKGSQLAEAGQMLSTWLLEPATSAAGDVQLEWLRSVDKKVGTHLLALMNRTLKEETTIGYPGPIDEVTGEALMRELNKDVQSGHRHVLVAFKGALVVGQLILTPNSSPNHRHIVELTRGTIDHSFRGGGLALRAFQEVKKKCEELEREVICLDVRAGTHAAIWWQHFGFRQYGLLSDYSRVGGKKYQGLYLTQTTAELGQRLAELSDSASRASA